MANSYRDTPSSLYKIDLLRADNWYPWKRRITALLRDRNLLQYVDGKHQKPKAKGETPTEDEEKEIRKWEEGDQRAQTQIELTLGDAEMVHILGATTAHQMWTQLCTVKENKGKLGILATQRRLFRTVAEEGFSMVEHIATFRGLQEELALMGASIT